MNKANNEPTTNHKPDRNGGTNRDCLPRPRLASGRRTNAMPELIDGNSTPAAQDEACKAAGEDVLPVPKRKRAPAGSRKPTTPASPLPSRTMDLIGVTEDDRLILWSANEQVQPVTKFETRWALDREWIVSDHYVINWKNHAIVVHCSSWLDGTIDVQFMCGGFHIRMTRAEAEAKLMGKVIPDPVINAQISAALKQLSGEILRRQDSPHRQRGRI